MLFQKKPFEVLMVVPREDTDKALKSMERIVQLEDFKFPKLRKMYPEKVKLVKLLSKLEAFAEQLQPYGELPKWVENPAEECEKLIEVIESDIERLNSEERDMNYRKKRLETMLELLDESEFIGVASLITKSLEEWETFQSKLQTEGVRVIGSKDYEHEKIALIKGVMEGYDGDNNRIRNLINNDVSKIKNGIEESSKKRLEMAQKYGPRINTLKKQLSSEIELLDEKRLIAHTELFSFIKGLVENKDVKALPKTGIVLAQPKKESEGFGNKYMKVIQSVISGKNV